MSALLTSVKDDKSTSNGPGRLSVYLNECRRMGIKVLPPDINESDSDFTPRGGDIRFGLSAVRNVGENVVASILATRTSHGRFADFPDFIEAVEIGVCNKRTIESLVKAGAFDSLGHTRKGLVRCTSCSSTPPSRPNGPRRSASSTCSATTTAATARARR